MKISALTAATTPLSGAELFPIVQSGNTRRVSLNDLLRSIGNGTAAAPALAPGGDPNTGIYFPAADTIGFVEGGVEVMRLTSAGDLRLTTSAAVFLYAGAGGVVESGFQLDALNQRIDAYTAGALRWRINGSGHFVAGADGTYDIGLSSSSRPRNLYLASGANLACPDNFVIYDSTSAITRFGFSTNNTYNVRTGGSHIFQVAGTERMRLDASGNLGLGVTPSAWSGLGAALQVNRLSLITGGTSAVDAYITSNAFWNGTAWTYIGTAAATQYIQNASGDHRWRIAPSGTAGTAITFTQAMTLDASGNLGIGVTVPNEALSVRRDGGAIFAVRVRNASNAIDARAAILFQNDVGETGFIGAHSSTTSTGIGFPDRIVLQSQTANGIHFVASNASGAIQFNTGGTASANLRWWISNSGHLLTGTDNTVDIGASGATRPRDLHLARNLVGAGWVRAGAASAGAASTTTIGGTTATTVGAAGAASALPANPLGYIVAHVGTTEVRIPYYNA